MGTIVKLADWPVVKTETNRERVIRALREAEGVVPQCQYQLMIGEKRCARGAIYDAMYPGWAENSAILPDLDLFVDEDAITNFNDGVAGLTFAQIADRLEADDSYWNEKGDEVWER